MPPSRGAISRGRKKTAGGRGGGGPLRELAFVFETDGFQAPDLLLLAEHLTRRSTPTGADPIIVDLAYQKRPDSRDDARLCRIHRRDSPSPGGPGSGLGLGAARHHGRGGGDDAERSVR